METIQGFISSIRYRNPDNGYSVLSFVVDDNEETLVGNFLSVSEGEMLKVTGEWVVHPIYDKQFKATSYESIQPEDELAVLRYLSSGIIKGIGPTLAKRIVDEFGKDTFMVMEEQPELLERVKGITLKKAQEIGVLMQEKRGYREAMMFLTKYGIGNALAIKVYSYYGDRIYSILKENPYKLAEDIPGIGFKTADEIAARLGVKSDSNYRIQSGILYTLVLAAGQGHMYLPKEILEEEASKILDVTKDLVQPEIDNLTVERKLIIKGTDVYAPSNFYVEQSVAGLLRSVVNDVFCDEYEDDLSIAKEVETIATQAGYALDPLQTKAVVQAVTNGVSIITGGPGTGKTTTIKTLIGYFEAEGMDIALAAPTGRAAKRMTEATGYEAKTIHRLLELNGTIDEDGKDAGFERNEDNPLDVDAVIVDEMSMVDIFLFRALLKAIPPGARLVMVGDAHQLPSVGPGQVLRDLLESECFPVTRLETIFRQEGSGDIVVNAHRINNGEDIETPKSSRDFFFIERSDPSKIMLNMVELITKNLPGYVDAEPFDIQVLTPTRKGNLGVITLNRYLQNALNPPSKDKAEHYYGEEIFREGDKVMQIRNNYQANWEILGKHNIPIDSGIGIFNGDMGRIVEIDESDSSLTVEFDDNKRVTYDFTNLDELELAYAITVHKSQGSEYGAVIMPVAPGPRQLMNRNLLYTGVTRAKKCLVMIGNPGIVHEMIENNHENLRYSGLKCRIIEMFS
ncbi:MAG: ATP-dependent RecD-like DNA helicase [Lachnospiraceae bacterium]|nr:ATP-dependent RecD-like DNA helicase [Lachnospiraceae bacterium]